MKRMRKSAPISRRERKLSSIPRCWWGTNPRPAKPESFRGRKPMAATPLIKMARVDRPAKADLRVRRPVAEEGRDPKQADQGVASQEVVVQEVRKPAKARGAAAAVSK